MSGPVFRITNLDLPVDHTEADLLDGAAKILCLPGSALARISIARQSVDARHKSRIRLVYTVDVVMAEGVSLPPGACDNPNVTPAPDRSYRFKTLASPSHLRRPVVVGAGPCGLFGALLLAKMGMRPLLIERGRMVRQRVADVRQFWSEGVLQPESNALFGEGGAGTFSDGKLTTQIRDKENRHAWILGELVKAGAPPDVLYSNRPHIGTDLLVSVVENLRTAIREHGGEFRFEHRMTGLSVRDGRLQAVIVNNDEEVPCSSLLLAIGHSARDTYHMLYDQGVRIVPKAFSIGARIEHPQTLINEALYGAAASHPRLGPADYKLVHHCSNGRSVYSFCMCPGGAVIGVSHEPETVVTNGMSCRARSGANANSGLLVGVNPGDFDDAHPLAGLHFQHRFECAAYRSGGGGYKAPVQLVGDLLACRSSNTLGGVMPSYTPGVTPGDLRECLPEYVIEAWREALPAMGRKLRGFDMPDAVLTGVETRSSAPVRIERDERGESLSLRGLFPAGEGAGYAGGIISSAVDGMRAAEQIALQSCGQP